MSTMPPGECGVIIQAECLAGDNGGLWTAPRRLAGLLGPPEADLSPLLLSRL